MTKRTKSSGVARHAPLDEPQDQGPGLLRVRPAEGAAEVPARRRRRERQRVLLGEPRVRAAQLLAGNASQSMLRVAERRRQGLRRRVEVYARAHQLLHEPQPRRGAAPRLCWCSPGPQKRP